jgi:pilus assembly protein CpaE
MRSVVVSDDEAVGRRLREALLRERCECAAADLVRLDGAATRLCQAPPELLVTALSPQPERALTVLSEVRRWVRGRVLVVGPASEPKLILRALRERADHYLDEADLEAELTGALARLQAKDHPPAPPGRLLAVLAPSGGSGASTLAINLATVLAQKHKSCALFDLKLETGDLAPLLDLKPTHTLADLCLHAGRMDRSLFERSLVRHASGVHLLPSPQTTADAVAVNGEGVRQSLSFARTLFPYVLADLDHSSREEQSLVLRQADVILLVFRLDFTSLRNARRALDRLEQLGLSRERVRLVANRYGQPKEVPVAKAEEALGRKIFHYVPDDPKTVNRANNNGVPAVLEYPRAGVSKSITALALKVNGQQDG